MLGYNAGQWKCHSSHGTSDDCSTRALAELPQVQVKRLAKGKLSIHEEFPEIVASAIMPFLGLDLQNVVSEPFAL